MKCGFGFVVLPDDPNPDFALFHSTQKVGESGVKPGNLYKKMHIKHISESTILHDITQTHYSESFHTL